MDNFHAERSGLYPLSLSQQNIWDIERTCPDTSMNNICTTLHIQGRVDFSALQRSVNLVLAADGSLRTRIALSDKTPFQYQAPFQPEQVPIYDFSQTSQEGIESWEEAFTREVMSLVDAPLYRFILLRTGENLGGLVIKMHHLISDGWTQVLLCNRIGQTYLDLLSGREPNLGQIPSYQSHVDEESHYLSAPSYEKDKDYWEQVLDQAGEPSVLKSVRGAAVSPVGRRLTFSLPQDLNNDIYTFCMSHRVAPFSVFCMALAIYFKRIGGADRFTIGVPIFNRMNFSAKQTSGMFVSTLPFFSEIRGDWTLNELNDRLNEGWFDMLRHQRFPFSHIQTLAKNRQEAADRLFHIAFSYQNSQLLESKDATVTFSGRWHYSGYQMEQLCIHLSNLENNRRYSVDYDYLTQLFSTQEIEILHSCLVNILREALASPDRPIRQLAVLSPAERERVLYTFNRSSRPIFESSLYGRFQRYARQNPSRAALICGGERTTYCQLEEQSACVHAALSQICAVPDTLVAILLPREPELFVSMMGILRAGGAFLLLSPNQPENRIREILSQSGAAALITTPTLGGRLADQISLVDMT
ncbi:MAG: condensation domain-containing protein, partial [Lawsonibacter sp.]